VDFVNRLKEKLTFAWDMAASQDKDAKEKSKQYFDRTATTRSFSVGDRVLALEPSLTDKFQPQWNGPYDVLEKVTDVTYRISTPDRRKKQRLYHVNSLKAWKEPVQVMTVQYCEETEEESAEEVADLPLYPFTLGGSNVFHINHELTLDQKDELNSLLRKSSAQHQGVQ